MTVTTFPLVVVEHSKRSVCHLNCQSDNLHPHAANVSETIRAQVVRSLAGCRCGPDLRKANNEVHVVHRHWCRRSGTHGRFQVGEP